jgi:RimJ/RimL family protein N-acetyltransferase
MDIRPVTLEGQYVRLEPLSPDHVDALWPAAAPPEVWAFTSAKMHTIDDLRAYLAEALADRNAVPFCTVDRATGKPVGTTRFANISVEHKRVEIGWTFVTPAKQRTAINTEAKYLMLRYAFETWGCRRVELKTNALNTKSRTAMLRIGAKEEGTLRRHMINSDGTFRDTVYFSIIAEEWLQVKAHLEQLLSRGTSSGRD